MPESFDYAIIRVVPRVERGEQIATTPPRRSTLWSIGSCASPSGGAIAPHTRAASVEFLAKPFTAEALEQTIARMLPR